jgi:hypothetical protein
MPELLCAFLSLRSFVLIISLEIIKTIWRLPAYEAA